MSKSALDIVPTISAKEIETNTALADTQESARNPKLWTAALLLALLLIVVFRAAFSAHFLLDDFGMLAIVRFLENPLEPFVRNHIPGGVYYRPLGMMLWWMSERMFGAQAVAHYVVNLVLHAGVAATLWSLISRFCGNRWVGLVAATCFAFHPIGVGTTLWLSDRFDLLALLFGLLGLRSALDFSRNESRRSFWMSIALLSLSLLSKEIALSCFAAAAVVWLHAESKPRLATRIRLCLSLVPPVLAYLAIRSYVLVFPGAGLLVGESGAVRLLVDGLGNWFVGWLDYWTYLSRLEGWKEIVSISALALLVALVLGASVRDWSLRRRQAFLAGLALWLSTGLLQVPLLAHFSVSLEESTDAINTVVSSRYFYSSLAGFLIAMAALLTPFCLARRWARVGAMIAISMLVVAWLPASQAAARRYRIETETQREIVDSAIHAMDKMDIPPSGCQIFLLDTNNWSFAWISDEAIKATTPNLQRIAGCLIQTEYTPWYHIAITGPLDSKTLRPLSLSGGMDIASAQQPIGKARFLILNLDSEASLPSDSKARFLSWQDHTFVDVTDDVMSGRRLPGFVCRRSPKECP
jgi:hypothetical protein